MKLDFFQDKTVLVTGATGFIGSNLTQKLIASGANVHIFARKEADFWRLEGLSKKSLEVWTGALENAESVNECVLKTRPELVFHAGALVNAERDPKLMGDMIQVNVLGTVNLITALLESCCECFINFGTCEEYGNGKAPFLENQRESPVSPYSASKVASTHFCQMIHRSAGFPIMTVRPFLTYGPGQISNMLIPSLIYHCLSGAREFRMTGGEQAREFNFISDIVDGILKVAQHQEFLGCVVNIGNGEEHKIIDVARLIVQLTQTSLTLETGSLPYREGEVVHFYADTEKYIRTVKPSSFIPLEEGLEKTIRWYHDYLKTHP